MSGERVNSETRKTEADSGCYASLLLDGDFDLLAVFLAAMGSAGAEVGEGQGDAFLSCLRQLVSGMATRTAARAGRVGGQVVVVGTRMK
jgi:hypothetical protein